MTAGAMTLAAISCGAVFMGANSYIGNAPNFMVYAIAKDEGVRMPSFFGYMLWSGRGADPGVRAGDLRVLSVAHAESRSATSSAIDSAQVRPGDSMPKRWTRPERPCSAGPSMTKSAGGSPGPVSFGRMPE